MQVDVGTWATAAVHSLGIWLTAGLVSGWVIGMVRDTWSN